MKYRLVVLAALQVLTYAESGSAVCAGCHRQVWETYQRTGMARSFYRLTPENIIEDFSGKSPFYHQPSDSYFTMLRRDGKYFQRRHQIDFEGKRTNVIEKQIDYVMGSGNHSRAYAHRTAGNKLIELPLAWYSEKGGYWAMNPGYDRPIHDGFRRALSYDCMFCHNAYPQVPAGNDGALAEPIYMGAMPEGIDCQRCHGTGDKHVLLAKTVGVQADLVRKSIVNPARMSSDRQMEVCMQCHLESTSFPLPNALQRFDRKAFSYQPDEPLASFLLFFDHAKGTGRDDKFEIVNSAYRIRRSACFLESKGKLGCTTCHNPHDVPRGVEATRRYDAVCQKCHNVVAAAKHPVVSDCASCHMPKRRTEDVVHVVMTDHLIQRHKPRGDLLAERVERDETHATTYKGKVELYYPPTLPHTAANDLDVAVAQVMDRSNLSGGIEQLTAAIARYSPVRSEYYLQLADALKNYGRPAEALTVYRQAVQREPKAAALQKLGVELRRAGQTQQAVETLKRSAALEPGYAVTWHELGLAYQAQGKTAEAVAAIQKAVTMDPDLSEAQNNLGVIWSASGDKVRAAAAFQEAIRIQPDYADAHANLGSLLTNGDDLARARYHFETSLHVRPDDAITRYNYAMVLGRSRQFDDAQRELETAARTDPKLVDVHLVLADLLMVKGQAKAAIPHYQAVVLLQPGMGRAQLGLGSALVASGDLERAVPHLRKAAANADFQVREAAVMLLKRAGK